MTDVLPAQKTSHPSSEALWDELPSLPCSLLENAVEEQQQRFQATQLAQQHNAAAQEQNNNQLSETIRASSTTLAAEPPRRAAPSSPSQRSDFQPGQAKISCPLPLLEPLDIDASALELTQSQSQSYSPHRQADEDDSVELAAKDSPGFDSLDLDDTGVSWTQANPSTQFQRRFWLAKFRPLGILDASSASSGDELPVKAILPKKRRHRPSPVNAEQTADIAGTRSAGDLGVGPSTISKPTAASKASKHPRPKARKAVAIAGDATDFEEVSGTQFFTRKTPSRARHRGSHTSPPRSQSVDLSCPESPDEPSRTATVAPAHRVIERTPSYVLTRDDEEALENFFLTDEENGEEELRFTGLRAAEEGPPLTNKVAAAREQAQRLETVAPILQGVVPSHHCQSSGTASSAQQYTEESSSQCSIVSVHLNGLAPMLNELDEEKQRGYWAQLDFAGPSTMHRSSIWDTAPETPAGSTGSTLLRAESDSRLLPNRRVAFTRPRIGGSSDSHVLAELRSPNQVPHSLDDEGGPSIQRPLGPTSRPMDCEAPSSSPLPTEIPNPRPPPARFDALDRSAAGPSTRPCPPITPAPARNMWLPGTSGPPSRNAAGMGMARKTWDNTWKEDGSRVVRGRVIRAARRDQEQSRSVAFADESPSGQRSGRVLRSRGRGRGRGARGR